ncbi:hypothetical protein ACT3UJ_06885 [Halomonas sp. 86]|uniref:hypothetical protein n=1 Tax=unclassified Halomonas TaxID=2609666 RepID=UPI0040335D1D
MTTETPTLLTQPNAQKPASPSTQMRHQMTVPSSNKEHAQRKNVYSRPIMDHTLVLYSLQAQQVMERSFIRVAYSLFSTDVILRIIGNEDEIDEVSDVIGSMLSEADKQLDTVIAQMEHLLEKHKVDGVDRYSNPVELAVEITAPTVRQFIQLVEKLDKLVMLVDSLWHAQVMTGKQRTAAARTWRQHINRTASRIIQTEGRARRSATNQGKDAEVKTEAPMMPDHAEQDANIAEDAGETTEGFPVADAPAEVAHNEASPQETATVV